MSSTEVRIDSGGCSLAATYAEAAEPVAAAHDLQVPPDDVAEMGRLVQGSFDGHVIPDLSHLLRPDPASLGPRGYLRLITDWVTSHWARS